MKGKLDPVVCYTSLREVIGTDLFGAVTCTDLASTSLSFCIVLFCKLHFIKTGTKYTECLVLILKLGFLILAGNYDSCRNMGKTYRRICGIDTLSTVSGCTEYIKLTFVQIQMEIDLLCLRHDRNGTSRSMDSSSGFRFRYSLHTMYTAFILQSRICALTFDHKCDFFKSTDPVLIQA